MERRGQYPEQEDTGDHRHAARRPEAVLVSRLTRMGNLVGSLTDELKARLQLPESARGEPTMIDSVSQLTPLELAALAHIGVGADYL